SATGRRVSSSSLSSASSPDSKTSRQAPHRDLSARLRAYAVVLSAILALFVGRVVAQALIAVGYGAFLPPWAEWFSGLVPYPQLLVSQILIILAYGAVCRDFVRQRGFFTVPRRWLGTVLLFVGSIYFAVMVMRYAIRMSLYAPERWTGGAIPIVF